MYTNSNTVDSGWALLLNDENLCNNMKKTTIYITFKIHSELRKIINF